MAKTTRKAGKRATAAGRGGLRARKSGVAKTHNAKLRKLKPAKPGPRKGKPSLPSETASLKRQLKAARMQQQASAEILRTVANASGDVARPLQQIAETTARLFGAPSVSIQLAEGGEFTQEYRVWCYRAACWLGLSPIQYSRRRPKPAGHGGFRESANPHSGPRSS